MCGPEREEDYCSGAIAVLIVIALACLVFAVTGHVDVAHVIACITGAIVYALSAGVVIILLFMLLEFMMTSDRPRC